MVIFGSSHNRSTYCIHCCWLKYSDVSLRSNNHCRMRPRYITHSLTLTLTTPFCLSLCVCRWSPTSRHSLCLTLSLSSSFISLCLSFSLRLSVCLSFCLCSWTAACLYVCQQHKQKHYGSERATSILLTLQEPQGQGGTIHWWVLSFYSCIHLFSCSRICGFSHSLVESVSS